MSYSKACVAVAQLTSSTRHFRVIEPPKGLDPLDELPDRHGRSNLRTLEPLTTILDKLVYEPRFLSKTHLANGP